MYEGITVLCCVLVINWSTCANQLPPAHPGLKAPVLAVRHYHPLAPSSVQSEPLAARLTKLTFLMAATVGKS